MINFYVVAHVSRLRQSGVWQQVIAQCHQRRGGLIDVSHDQDRNYNPRAFSCYSFFALSPLASSLNFFLVLILSPAAGVCVVFLSPPFRRENTKPPLKRTLPRRLRPHPTARRETQSWWTTPSARCLRSTASGVRLSTAGRAEPTSTQQGRHRTAMPNWSRRKTPHCRRVDRDASAQSLCWLTMSHRPAHLTRSRLRCLRCWVREATGNTSETDVQWPS